MWGTVARCCARCRTDARICARLVPLTDWGLRSYIDADDPDKCYELGCEPTPDLYVANMVAVFREVKRVLRDDGTLWLNLGSTFAANRTYQIDGTKQVKGSQPGTGSSVPPGYKPKDLVPIPWLVALALQADGWYLRSDIIWSKVNPMPGSQGDRPTTQHEYIFLLSKNGRYCYDGEAVKEQSATNADGKRTLRSVWTIATSPCPAAHFATFPEALVVPCVKAGTSERGCCPECGKPWERVVEKTDQPDTSAKGSRFDAGKTAARDGGDRTQQGDRTTTRTVGWQPGCSCDAGEPVPCTVLDPFLGAGTVGLVSAKLGRDWIGCELNPEYAALAQDRIDHGGDWQQVEQAKAGQVRLLDA